MSLPTTFVQWTDGVQGLASDFGADNTAVRNLVGEALQIILGAINALPASGAGQTPLTIVPSTTALSVTIGGPGQAVLAQGRVVDTCPAQVITLNANASGSPRTDLISVQYGTQTTNAATRNFEDNAGNVTTNILNETNEIVSYAYSAGSTTAPPGYVPFATIVVPNGATSITSAAITYLFATVSQLLTAVIGTLVTGINGQAGAITMVGSTGIALSSPSTGTIQITNTGVTALNGFGGNLTIQPGTGITVAATASGIIITNNGVTSFAGQTGAVALNAGTGIGLSQPDSTHTTITNTGVTSLQALVGAITLVAGTNVSSIVVAGNTITINVAATTGATGATGPTGPAGLNYRGTWSNSTTYAQNDAVSYNSSFYISTAAGNVGNTPPAGAWSLLAGAGPAGPAGGVGTHYIATGVTTVGNSKTVTLPFALGTGNWVLKAHAMSNFGTSGTMSLTGSGGTWPGGDWGSVSPPTQYQGEQWCFIVGTAIGGQTPSVTMNCSGNATGNPIVITLEATRMS